MCHVCVFKKGAMIPPFKQSGTDDFIEGSFSSD
jgi:hypothetical protein